VGQCNELLVGGADPNSMEVGHMSHHAIDDSVCFTDAFGGKLLHLLIDRPAQSAKFVHAQK
jgi:hypothetical protein